MNLHVNINISWEERLAERGEPFKQRLRIKRAFIGRCFFCSFRWMYLLNALGVSISLKSGMQLSAIGLLFNTVMPGAVGGDVIKAMRVRSMSSGQVSRLSVLYSIILDRIFEGKQLKLNFESAKIKIIPSLREKLVEKNYF